MIPARVRYPLRPSYVAWGLRGLALLPAYVVLEAVCKMARRWK